MCLRVSLFSMKSNRVYNETNRSYYTAAATHSNTTTHCNIHNTLHHTATQTNRTNLDYSNSISIHFLWKFINKLIANVCKHIFVYIHIYLYVHMYMYNGRKRSKGGYRCWTMYTYMHTHIFMGRNGSKRQKRRKIHAHLHVCLCTQRSQWIKTTMSNVNMCVSIFSFTFYK